MWTVYTRDTLHDVGFKLEDGTLWSFVNNKRGHDVIRAHHLVTHKNAQITGWLYPNAHHIELDSIVVEGVSSKGIAKAAWEEDQKIAQALLHRKFGKAPLVVADEHHH